MMFIESDWNYCIKIKHQDWQVVETWCQQNIGQFNQKWYKLGIDMAQPSIYDDPIETEWLFVIYDTQ